MKNSPLNTKGLNLLIPDKRDEEREGVAIAFERHGGTVHRIGRFWDPPKFDSSTVRVYGPDSFCMVLQQKLNFQLHSPPNTLLFDIPFEFLKREIRQLPLNAAFSQSFPSFVKPIQPKEFRAGIYNSADDLAKECQGLALDTSALWSESVLFTAEMRCFALSQKLLDASLYEGEANIPEGLIFAEGLLKAMPSQHTVVADLGFIQGRGWSLVEFNATWGSGLNGCDPEKVLPAIVAASGR